MKETILWSLTLLALFQCYYSSIEFQPQGVMHERFCTLPFQDKYRYPLSCTYLSHNTSVKTPVNCNSTTCECSIENRGFKQSCVYNSTHSFTRSCEGFKRSCFLLLNPYGPTAECSDTYRKCEMTTTVQPGRFAAGTPSYNPPSCEPVIAPAKDGCNTTINSCKSVSTYKFGRSPLVTMTGCSMHCQAEQTACTNYTKSCDRSLMTWKLPSPAASVSHHICNVTTHKCIVNRYAQWIPFAVHDKPSKSKKHHHGETGKAVMFESLKCGVDINMTESLKRCRNMINTHMLYKAEWSSGSRPGPELFATNPLTILESDCLLQGLEFLDFLVKTVYEGNTTLSEVVGWLEKEWFHAVGNLCHFDCFHVLVREMRFCMEDLPLQNILPGMTTKQFEKFLFSSAELICSSSPTKKKDKSCVIYTDSTNKITSEIVRNLTGPCQMELHSKTTACTMECREHLEAYVIPRDRKPGCCLGDIKEYERKNEQWLNLLSPSLMKKNYLNRLVDHCLPELEIKTCKTMEMHPIVVTVIVILVLFSLVLVTGVITFVIIFYRQQEHEQLQYKKTFLNGFINMKPS